jgi:hypothetical protein
MRTTLVVAALSAAAAVLLATPAPAGAATWKGKTRQGRSVSVRTGADGLVERVRISWRAPCRRGRYVDRALFLPPFDFAQPTAFHDAGTYRVRLDRGYRARLTVGVRGALDGDRWRGRFRVKVLVTRNRRWADTCELRGLRWWARPV